MTTATRRRAESRIEQGWIRCPACRQLFKDSHSCHASALGRATTGRRPAGFAEQVDQARAQARADAAAAAQLALDELTNPCADCGRTDLDVDTETGRCASCMYAAALAAAGLSNRGGTIAAREPGRAPP
ncbi:hypothetical protein ACK8HX_02210 [Oryzobacter sp. R7]|uniref:hypothetical protein n=1 Tax=Oryzobacter faecalis TaxID=3388656 RepID=UPI00398D2ADB